MKANIVTFITLLNLATAKQSSQITSIDTAIVALDAASVASANGIFFVYSSLQAKYYLTPSSIDIYFDIEMLHYVAQMVFNAMLKVVKPRRICSRKMNTAKYSAKFTLVGDIW